MTISVNTIKKGDKLISKSKNNIFYPDIVVKEVKKSGGKFIYLIGERLSKTTEDTNLNLLYLLYSDVVRLYRKRVLCVKRDNDIYC